MNELPYEMVKLEVTKQSLAEFSLYDNRRRIRPTQVRGLSTTLRMGRHFDAPIAVNMNQVFHDGDGMMILDGNHRYEALQEFFVTYPDRTVEVWAMVYDIDSPEAEKKKWVELNSGMKPSPEDLIQQYAKSNKFIKKFIAKIPQVCVYGNKIRSPLKFKVALVSVLNAIADKHHVQTFSALTIINQCEIGQYDDDEINVCNAFLSDYESAFGKLTKKSMWTRSHIFAACMRIWFQNKTIPVDVMIDKFRKLINHPTTIEMSRMSGKETEHITAEKFCEIMNRSSRKYKVVAEHPQVQKVLAV